MLWYLAKPHLNSNNFINRHSLLHIAYDTLSLQCKIFAIWLVEKVCTFLTFLIATVQISIECETKESYAWATKHLNL